MKGWGGVEWVGGRKREREGRKGEGRGNRRAEKKKKKTRGTSPESGRRDTDEREKRRVNQSKVV